MKNDFKMRIFLWKTCSFDFEWIQDFNRPGEPEATRAHLARIYSRMPPEDKENRTRTTDKTLRSNKKISFYQKYVPRWTETDKNRGKLFFLRRRNLGEGGFGKVTEVVDILNGDLYALKESRKQLTAFKMEDFKKEVETVAAFVHVGASKACARVHAALFQLTVK